MQPGYGASPSGTGPGEPFWERGPDRIHPAGPVPAGMQVRKFGNAPKPEPPAFPAVAAAWRAAHVRPFGSACAVSRANRPAGHVSHDAAFTHLIAYHPGMPSQPPLFDDDAAPAPIEVVRKHVNAVALMPRDR